MKDKNNKIDIEIKGKIESKINSQNQRTNDINGAKSGGNTPSDLGAIKKPISQKGKRPLDYATNQNITSENNLSNNNGAKNNLGVKKIKQEITKNRMPINKNPILNQNRMKNFGKIKKNVNPTLNPSASFFNNAKGIFNGKGLINKATSNSFDSLSSTTSKHSKNNPGIVDRFLEKKVDFNLFAIFNALPVHVKFVIVGGGMLFFLIFLILIIVIADDTSSADGNRDMKTEYIQGHYTEDELCKYLEKNNYISLKAGETCEDTKAYTFLHLLNNKQEFHIKVQH